ncbi:MAG: hypothetical protein IPH32_12095 [Bacteroidetes bacterium]|nr:hypothetical protein [Bacteroidota bacterium]
MVISGGSDEGVLVFNPLENKFVKVLNFGEGADSKYNNRIISYAKDKNELIFGLEHGAV